MNTQRKEKAQAPVTGIPEHLPSLGPIEDDICRQLSETAVKGIIQIEKAVETEYNVRVLSESIAKTIHRKARLLYIQYCEKLIEDLQGSAASLNNKF